MEEKKTITLDLTKCKYLGELHERIRVAFDFPVWYGANWDAFWDLLRSECDADKLEVFGVDTLPTDFDEEIKFMKTVLEKFKNSCKKYDDFFEYEFIDRS